MAKNEKQKEMAASGEHEVEKKEGAERAGIADAKTEKPAGKYEVRFGLFPSEGSVKGVCTVTIGGEFAVKNVKLVEGSKGLFISMPAYKSGDEYRDIFYPVTKEARAGLQEAVIAEYENQMQIHKYDHAQTAQQPQEAPMGLPVNAIQ